MGRSEQDDGGAAPPNGRRRPRLALVGLIIFCGTLAAAAVVRTLSSPDDGTPSAAVAASTSVAPSSAPSPVGTVAVSTTPSTVPATDAPESTTTSPAPGTTAGAATTAATTAASDPAPADPALADTPPVDTTPADTGVADPVAAAFDPTSLDAPVRWAVFDAGRVSLLGRIPSRASADTIARKAAAIVGADNVTVGYTIDPAAPLVASGPLFVADTVLFASESARIGPEFQALLDLGRTLLANNPKVSITVIGRADRQGDAGYNLRLSQQRAQAAVDYLAAGLDDAARLTAVGLGASAPLADDGTDAGRQVNRSVAFVITGLLDD